MAGKDIEIQLKGVRLSFADIYEPKARTDNDGKPTGEYYRGANFLIPKKLADGSDNPQVEIVRDAMRQALENEWPGLGKKIPPERRCFRDGEPKDEETGERSPLYDGYEGCYFLSANKAVKATGEAALKEPNNVQILGPTKSIIDDATGNARFPMIHRGEDGERPYAGCYVDAIVRIYAYNGKGQANRPDRINASLEAIKFKRHGESFGAKPVDAQNKFEEEEGDDDGFTSKPAAKSSAPDDDDI